MAEWTIEQVPLLAWYRFRSRPKDVYRIDQIDMQYVGGGFAPGLTIKASPAVSIGGQFWRINELNQVFDVSIDGFTWQECAGEIGGRGTLADRLARVEAALAANGKVSEDVSKELAKQLRIAAEQRAESDKLLKRLEELHQRQGALIAASEKLPAGNSAQGSEPPKDPPKSNPGAKPPEQKK